MTYTKRFWKAYTTFLSILFSYLIFSFWKKIFGEMRLQEASEKLHRKNARRIEKAILELKGLFIKMGQMLSIMSNFLPPAFTEGLERLQDDVPPHPYAAIEKRFLEEFQKTPKEIFQKFEETPIASASLGQVHVAYLKDGTKVAVKVQYPEIDEIVKDDLVILRRIFAVLHLILPAYGLKSVFEEISEVVLKELDYQVEAQNIEAFRKNFADQKTILFPEVFSELSSKKVLTQKFVEGFKVSSVQQIEKEGLDSREIATQLIHAFCKQIFIDGLYHADPHPGNILIRKQDGSLQIILLDFGATATISENMRHGITSFAEGLIRRDTKLLASAMREMGFVARQDSFDPFEDLVEYFYSKLANLKIENFRKLNISEIHNLEDILELKKLKISFRDLMNSFHVPKDWILLERTLLLAMGLCAHLAPTLNPIEIVLPYVEQFVLKDRTFTEVVVELTKQVVLSYIQLPHELHKTLKRLNDGTLSMESKGLERHTRQMYALGHQFLYGFLSLASLGLSFHWGGQGFSDYSAYALYGAGFFTSVLVISFFRNRL
ncbi:MAG: AarF/ABC1/UbiB kinase family protein [Deltaproteobacteria bacterium]|nr:MAG: AarF/ABC1/UbiB kinase family protein [Deltaproteobacteria bacterium]